MLTTELTKKKNDEAKSELDVLLKEMFFNEINAQREELKRALDNSFKGEIKQLYGKIDNPSWLEEDIETGPFEKIDGAFEGMESSLKETISLSTEDNRKRMELKFEKIDEAFEKIGSSLKEKISLSMEDNRKNIDVNAKLIQTESENVSMRLLNIENRQKLALQSQKVSKWLIITNMVISILLVILIIKLMFF